MYTKRFNSFWLSMGLSNAGDILYTLCLVTYIYSVTGKVTESAMIPIITTIGIFLSGFAAPYILTLFQSTKVMLTAQMIKTILLVIICYFMIHHAAVHYYFAMIFLISFTDGLMNPVKNSLVPSLVDKEHITKANAWINMINNGVQIGGWGLGAVLIAMFGEIHVLMIIITIYIICSLMMVSLLSVHITKDRTRRNIFRQFHIGLTSAFQTPLLKTGQLITLIESFSHTTWISAIMLVYVKEQLHADMFWFGVVNGIFFAGLILGSIIAIRRSYKIEQNGRVIIIWTPVLLFLFTFIFGVNTTIIIAVIISFLFGIFDQLRMTLFASLFQNRLPADELENYYVFNGMIYAVSFALSTYIMSQIAEHYGAMYSFITASFIYLIVFIISIYRRTLWQFDEQ